MLVARGSRTHCEKPARRPSGRERHRACADRSARLSHCREPRGQLEVGPVPEKRRRPLGRFRGSRSSVARASASLLEGPFLGDRAVEGRVSEPRLAIRALLQLDH